MKLLITLNVNGDDYELAVRPSDLLIDVIREELGLTGTKRACDTGKCGACTMIMNGRTVRACLVLAVTANGARVVTIEGLATDGALHPLQRSFVEHGAIQCGFCTPGMIMFAKAFLDENPTPSREQIREALTANICRCTGYVKILDAVEAVVRGEYAE